MNRLKRFDAWLDDSYETTRGFVLLAYGFIGLAAIRTVIDAVVLLV